MKYAVLFFFLLSINAFGQVRLPTNEVGQVQYQEIVRVPDAKLPARQLMQQIRTWADEHYANESTAEQQPDLERNILFVKSAYPIDNQLIRYTLTVEAKFGRYRATITDMIAESNGLTVPVRASSGTVNELDRVAGSKITNKQLIEQTANQQANLYRQIDKSCRDTLASLKQSLTGGQK